jgi:D-glycero-D-manno-heptose 1,7-bisphosphate phosphatase
MVANSLIILDRDGVINHDSDNYIKSVEEWQPIEKSCEAIAKLTQANYQVAVATNQSGLARGYFNEETLSKMHDKMCALIRQAGGEISTIKYCPHGPNVQCDCRKPKAGLIDQIELELNVSAKGAYFVGDSLSDLQAATKKKCIPILVKTGKGMRTLVKIHNDSTLPDEIRHVAIYENLADFVHFIERDGMVK